jgi:hypothetical protein
VELFLNARFRVRSQEKARLAEQKVMEALDRLESELDGCAFMCGDVFDRLGPRPAERPPLYRRAERRARPAVV